MEYTPINIILRQLRGAAGLKQANVAKATGITNYSQVEQGKATLTLPKIQKLAELFKILPSELLEKMEPMETQKSIVISQLQHDNATLKSTIQQAMKG